MGVAFAALLRQRVSRPDRVFVVAVVLVLLVFAVNPFLATEEALTILALQAEHLAAAAAATAALLPALREHPARSAMQAAPSGVTRKA